MQEFSEDIKQAKSLFSNFFKTGKSLSFKAKETVYGNDEERNTALWIEVGFVKAVSYTASGKEMVHILYGPGDLFPMHDIYDKPRRDVIFIALSDVTVRLQPISKYREFIETEPTALLANVIQQMRAYERLFNLGLDRPEQRVASRILSLAERFGAEQDGHLLITMPMNQQVIADTVNLSRETTGRILNRFEERGYIVFGRKNVLVWPSKLQAILEKT